MLLRSAREGLMTLQELQNQALQLPISDRWRLVQSLLNSIQSETLAVNSPKRDANSFKNLNSWTRSLIGVIHLSEEISSDSASYVDYLEEKYS